MNISLYYLSPNPYGGWVTYTAHLIKALKAAGATTSLYKIRPRSERKNRNFGYDAHYRNITLDHALRQPGPKLIVAAAKKFQTQTAALIDAGAHLVLHDPTELKNLPPVPQARTIVIRRASLGIAPGATFIRHPYQRQQTHPGKKDVHAVSTARIDFDKHTEMILEANRLLPKERQVQIHGFENRLYGKFKLMPKYPEWELVQSTHNFERTMRAATEFLMPAKFNVDMSEIKGDGGGTQYTFLEAWDAGAVPVINTAWNLPDDDMLPGINCMAVKDGEELAELLWCDSYNLPYFQRNGLKQLELHDPELIGTQYIQALT